jgi:hypothetical protein
LSIDRIWEELIPTKLFNLLDSMSLILSTMILGIIRLYFQADTKNHQSILSSMF